VALGNASGLASESMLYGEDGARVVASCGRDRVTALLALAESHGVPAEAAGRVGAPDGTLEIHLRDSHATFGWTSGGLRRAYFDAIPRRMQADGERVTEGR
jgi:hypothetical protein